MLNHFLDDEQMQADTWQIIGQFISGVDDSMPVQVDLRMLLTPPIHEKLATGFLQQHWTDKTLEFLSTDQLVDIASKIADAETDISQAPGVYIFCCLADQIVLKVGQSEDMQRRIAREHLQKATMNTDSLLIDYAKRTWEYKEDAKWHQSLRDHEVTALLFPMRKSEKVDRLLIEQSLEAVLKPSMP